MSKKANTAIVTGGCAAIAAILILIYAIATATTMAVWNWALVPLFHFPPLEWGQAFLIYLGISLVGGAFRTITSK